MIPGSGRSPGEVNGTPLQYSYLGNAMDRGAWQATVHEAAKWCPILLQVGPAVATKQQHVLHQNRYCMCAKSLQSCPTLCDPVDCSPPGSCFHGILQARTLEWIAIPSSRGSSQPRDQTLVSYVSCIGRQVLYH